MARPGAVVTRHGGARLALALPGVGAESAARAGEEVSGVVPEALRPKVAVAEARPGVAGDEVLSRARSALG